MENNVDQMERAQKVCQQYITELTLNAITLNVIQNRKAINGIIIDVINKELSETMKNVKLTDPSLAAKIGWLTIRTGFKVALNAVSMGFGGVLLNEIHELLGTHGSSIFELNKTMVSVPGSEGKVAVRTDADWDREASFSEIGNQFLSDYSDIVVSELIGETKDRYLKKVRQLFCLEGLDLKKIEHNTALMLYYVPCDILQAASKNFDTKIYSHCIEIIDKIKEAEKMDSMKLFAEVKKEIDKLLPMAYISELNEVLTEELKVPRTEEIRKIFLAEIFSGNAEQLLETKKVLSNDLWKILNSAGLIGNVKTDKMESELTKVENESALYFEKNPQNGTSMELSELKIHKDYAKYLSSKKVWEMVIYANKHKVLGVSNKKKFGHSSSIATIIRSFNYLSDLKEKIKVKENKLIDIKDWNPI